MKKIVEFEFSIYAFELLTPKNGFSGRIVGHLYVKLG